MWEESSSGSSGSQTLSRETGSLLRPKVELVSKTAESLNVYMYELYITAAGRGEGEEEEEGAGWRKGAEGGGRVEEGECGSGGLFRKL